MIRARAWVAKALVSLASRILGTPLSADVELEEEVDSIRSMAGHPVVVRSERAEEMILEGLRRVRPEKKVELPLEGSLQDRMNRRDF